MAELAWVIGVQGRILHEEELGAPAERRERGGVGAGQPGLGAEVVQRFEQGRTPLAIQVSRHLVKQQDRLPLARRGAQPRLGAGSAVCGRPYPTG